MKKVVVTGASGFIGRALTQELLRLNYKVYAIVRKKEKLSSLSNPNLYVIEADFEDYSTLSRKIPECDFEAFFHLAWSGYGTQTNDYNVQMQNVLYSCHAATAASELNSRKFIFAGSSHEYLTCTNPSNVLHHCSIYGTAKRCARKMVQTITHNNNMVFHGVIFTNIFGPGDSSERSTNTMIRKIQKDKFLDLIEGNTLYDWTYIDDCVGGMVAVMTKGKPHYHYYVGSRVLRPFSEIISEFKNIVSPDAVLNFGKYKDSSFIDYRKINTYALYQDTGYLSTSIFEESIIKTVSWLNNFDSNTN